MCVCMYMQIYRGVLCNIQHKALCHRWRTKTPNRPYQSLREGFMHLKPKRNFGIYTEFSKLYKNNKQVHFFRKWVEDLNRHLTKQGIQEANKNIRRCFTLCIIRKKQIATTLNDQHPPVREAKLQNHSHRHAGEEVEPQ